MTNIKDLAKMAGVSVTTVSRVLNNHPYVSEEKKNAVLEAVKISNYHKNINAVHLSTGKTSLMGVVLPFSDHPYFALLLKGIAKKALEYNYKLVLFQTDYTESRELEALQMLKQKQIDSLIICSRTCDLSTIEEHLPYGPIVLCENIKGNKVSTTFVNHYKIFLEALEYLYHKGHNKIGYCIGRRSGTNSRERESAYRDFVKKYNLPYKSDYVMDECYYFEDGEKVIKQIQEMDTPPSALLVTSDQVAAGMVTCCKNRRISIPDELAIIGFDNQPIAKMMNITTIEIPLEDMGKNLFLQAVNGELSDEELPAKLIERGTV
ncbi:transcriptional regulator, LacI family [Paenibacillus sophorae]|uniref:LacI family DNA-binding transcriptional regulator n=1 Tax=Paenibacillus sophorae TaxID=1333845 RepID=A0A1H8F838_9BACL|nr:LacI family DNA-binding transcriptional regulator [Paenibacillus sophorae]QWU13798.1 LacI family DNA-binding transcriptional regulator [Paenibacillus sophorae]SEN28101.1 transcriptional regulator, LacI family [Paenibacillus sophorae]